MKSIRLSLMLYFLVLLALALGAASLMAYQYAERILAEKDMVRLMSMRERANKDRKTEEANLLRGLRMHTGSLARQLQRQFAAMDLWHGEYRRRGGRPEEEAVERDRLRIANLRLAPLAGLSPAGDATALLSEAFWLMRTHAVILKVNEDLLEDPNRHDPNFDVLYFQVNVPGVGAWRSRAMGSQAFPFEPSSVQRLRFWPEEEHVEPVDLETGVRLQVLTAKVPVRFPSWRPGMSRVGPARPRPSEPAILIQFGADTTNCNNELLKIDARISNEEADVRKQSYDTLAELRNRLLLISMATFVAIVIGGFWLVRVGLSPLHRLSVAVSQVSVKDFRLPFEEQKLPVELRPIVERLTQTLDLLKRAFAREKQAAADISHDLRTPLAALLTTIEVGLRKPRTPEEYRELLQDCHAAGTQINQLVERLLALARLDAVFDTLRRRNVDVSNLAEQCADLVRPLALARNLTVRVHKNGPVQVNTDADKLREILTNLLHNAIQYNQPNGSIDLTVERENGQVHLEVRDTGIGIAPEAREQIFERFYRVDSSRHADDGMHAGLGLAIVKGYVELMGGKIDVESTLGKGSVFSLDLPA